MDVGKSIRICLAKENMTRKDLARKLKTTPNYVGNMCHRETCAGTMLDRLASTFGMSVSEFIALGED